MWQRFSPFGGMNLTRPSGTLPKGEGFLEFVVPSWQETFCNLIICMAANGRRYEPQYHR